jgi:toxin-antitoxin system PIN domain toxin
MSGVIDTNLLLYAANRDGPEHRPARAFLDSVRQSAGVWYVTEGIGYEFLRVATHSRVFATPLTAVEALRFWEALLAWPAIALLSASAQHWRVLRGLIATQHAPAGNLFFDLRTAALMREHGIRTIYTADADFHRIKEIEVVNPLHPPG